MKRLSLCWLPLCCLVGSSAFAQAEEKPAELFAQDVAAIEALPSDANPAEEAAAEATEDAEPTEEELKAQVQELNLQMRQVQQQLQQVNGPQGRGPDAIEEIVLPENPTREDYVQFVSDLEAATVGQNRFSSNDPQVEKLKQIPVEHIDLLVGLSNRSSLRYHSQYALRDIDLSPMRDRLDEMLRDEPSIIGLIVTRGWCGNARDAIVDKVNRRETNLGLAWFQAAAEINEPELYDALHDCAVQTNMFVQVVPILESMPGYDLERTVNEIWRRSKAGEVSVNSSQVAQVAVRFGKADALEILIQQIKQQSNNAYYYHNGENTTQAQRLIVLRHIDFSGGPEEIANWYDANKNDLVFDYLTQRFMLASDF